MLLYWPHSQEDARTDAVDSLVRDIHNIQCLLNVEYSGLVCPHVTLQFADSKDDVGLGLVKEGLVMVEVRKEKHLQKMVSRSKYKKPNSMREATDQLFWGGDSMTALALSGL